MKPERASNIIPAFEGSLASSTGIPGRPLGAILIDSGKLTLEEAERVVSVQRENGMRFGEAATMLGLITEADLRLALARQFDYPYLLPGESDIDPEVIAAYRPFDQKVEMLRALRTQLMVRWLMVEGAEKAISVVSAERGDGRSFLAANLAVVFSQLGERTLLVDADLRNPRQHNLFRLDNRSGLSAILSGRGDCESIQRVPQFRDLSVIPAGAMPPNPQELLARPYFKRLLAELERDFNVVIVDSPAGGEFADAQFIGRMTGAAVMIVRKNRTRIKTANTFVSALQNARVNILGTVLNEA